MARSGVLSDVAIKHHCPEWFAPDIAVQKALQPVHFHHHILHGIKIPTEMRTHRTLPRYPAYDIHNFSTIAAPQRSQEAFLEGVHNYRKELGSDNHPTELRLGYEEQVQSTHKPYPMKARSTTTAGSSTYLSDADTDVADLASLSHFSTVPASLTLGKMPRKQAREKFDQEISIGRNLFQPESRALMANIGTGQALDILFPGGSIPAHSGKMSHGEVLSKLSEAYRGSGKDLAILNRADAAARAHGVIPEQSEFMDSIIE
jgi:hypothetical protein